MCHNLDYYSGRNLRAFHFSWDDRVKLFFGAVVSTGCTTVLGLFFLNTCHCTSILTVVL